MLESSDSFGDCGSGEVDAPAELLVGESAVELKLGEDVPVCVVDLGLRNVHGRSSFHLKPQRP
jgi:hypothetical protein